MSYDCRVKESKENGQTKFTIEIVCQHESKEKYDNGQCKPIIATSVTTGQKIRFKSIRQASDMLITEGTSATREKRIGECLSGRTESKYGFYWEYE